MVKGDILQTAGLVIALAAPSPAKQDSLSVDQAIQIVRPVYNALTAASPADVRVHLESRNDKGLAESRFYQCLR